MCVDGATNRNRHRQEKCVHRRHHSMTGERDLWRRTRTRTMVRKLRVRTKRERWTQNAEPEPGIRESLEQRYTPLCPLYMRLTFSVSPALPNGSRAVAHFQRRSPSPCKPPRIRWPTLPDRQPIPLDRRCLFTIPPASAPLPSLQPREPPNDSECVPPRKKQCLPTPHRTILLPRQTYAEL